MNPFSCWVDLNQVSTDFRITKLNHTIDHSLCFNNPYFSDFSSLRQQFERTYYHLKTEFPGFFKIMLNCAYNFVPRSALEIVENFDSGLGIFRQDTRCWFTEFVFLFWDQCYLLLHPSLLQKLRVVFLHEFDCLPQENGSVFLYHNPMYG